MKKIVLVIALAIVALSASVSVSAKVEGKRSSVSYVSLSALTNLSASDWGVGAAFGFRNYNRNSFVSFAPSIEVFGEFFPNDKVFGAFVIPELGVAIGPAGFKLFPHTGFMLGYDNQTRKFAWGGKSGFSLDFGKHFTFDVSTYIPKFDFKAMTWGAGIVWRF